MIAEWPHWLTLRIPTAAEVGMGLGLFALFAFLSLAVTVFIIVKLPADYFLGPTAPDPWHGRHPVLRAVGHIGKNILGIVVIIAGIIMSLPGVPGQGLLTILIGLMLVDFPGKRKMEQKLVRRPGIHNFINKVRSRYQCAPIQLDPSEDHSG